MNVDWLIVGAGLSGATLAERIASQRGESVLIVEKRDHIAGNAYDEYNEFGILEHKYGPHIFHTNSTDIWQYLSQFTEWRPYFHKVLASIDGQLVPVPFNLNSLDKIFPQKLAERYTEKLVSHYGFGSRVPILKMRETNDEDLRNLADFVYKKVFENYTFKQWELAPEALSPSVTARVPILVSRDDRYFQDTYQAMPLLGYTTMVRKMLAHPNIHLMLNTDWKKIKQQISFKRMIFTGPIDEYFDYKYGELPYRSLDFKTTSLPIEQYQAVATVNYPNEYLYTRITEQKQLTGQKSNFTTLLYEYPQQHRVGHTIPYYPIPTEDNKELYALYRTEAEKIKDQVLFVGRLANYMYYNMDQAVAAALAVFRKSIDNVI